MISSCGLTSSVHLLGHVTAALTAWRDKTIVARLLIVQYICCIRILTFVAHIVSVARVLAGISRYRWRATDWTEYDALRHDTTVAATVSRITADNCWHRLSQDTSRIMVRFLSVADVTMSVGRIVRCSWRQLRSCPVARLHDTRADNDLAAYDACVIAAFIVRHFGQFQTHTPSNGTSWHASAVNYWHSTSGRPTIPRDFDLWQSSSKETARFTFSF